MRRAALACLLLGATATATAHAEPRVHVLGGTDFPVDVGGGMQVEGPGRLRLLATVGYMPGPYVDSINTVVVALDGYSQRTADLIKLSLSSSLVLRAHLGWRPWSRHGFTFSIGYGLITLGGGVGTAEVAAAATGQDPPSGAPDLPSVYEVDSTLHMANADVGWDWRLADDRMLIRAAIGFTGTVYSSTSVEPQGAPFQVGPVRDFADYAADYLDDVYQSYFFSPTFTVMLGYRLGD